MIILLQGCFPSFTPSHEDRLIYKQTRTPEIEVEWYTFSTAYAESPDFVVLTKAGKTDTVCASDNVADVVVKGSNTVIVGFYGAPSIYMEGIQVPDSVLGCPIVIDTSYVPAAPKVKKHFKENSQGQNSHKKN